MKSSLLLAIGLVGSAPFVAAQDWARERLEKTSRHLEWVTVKHGDREVKAFVGFPEVSQKATAVVVLHENQGLTDWVRGVVDQLAEAGFVAIAPDLLSGSGPNGGGTAELGSRDAVGKALSALNPEQITADIAAVARHVAELPASNGKVVVAGFCWGGRQTFRFATNHAEIKAALVFYGDPPSAEADIARINAPVYGFYGGNDARINSTIPKTEEPMKKAGKIYEPVIYENAGHGFMRAGEAPPPSPDAEQKAKDAHAANKKAREEAWKRVKAILVKI